MEYDKMRCATHSSCKGKTMRPDDMSVIVYKVKLRILYVSSGANVA